MLEETKKLYQESANLIPNWKQLDKNVLCNLYVQNEFNTELANSYLSAIILKYWNKIYSLQANTYLTSSLEDAYNWLVEGILYALKHRRWLDEDSNIYNDPNGPDKAINRKIKCIRLNHLVSENRDKRKIGINILSLDSFDDSDNFIGEELEYSDTSYRIIIGLLKSHKYNQAVIVDLISNGDGFIKDGDETVFSATELANIIYDLDDNYFDYFKTRYNLTNEVLSCIMKSILYDYEVQDLWGFGTTYIKKSISTIQNIVTNSMEELKDNKEIYSLLC